jgi:hypothetical protein
MILDIEDDSFLSPLFVGFHPPREGFGTAKDAFMKACNAVPPVQSSRKRMVGRRQSVSDPYTREVICYAGVPNETLSRARCVDRAPTETGTDAAARWQWEASLTEMKKGVFAPTIPEDLSVFVVEITRFRLSRGVVRNAAQLALLRSLFIQFLRVHDPEVLVVGGQREWRPTMWTLGS